MLDPKYGPVYCLFLPSPTPPQGAQGPKRRTAKRWRGPLFCYLFWIVFSTWFWTRFGSLWGSHMGVNFGPFGCSSCPKFGPRRLLRRIFVKNRIFKKTKENQWFFKVFAPQDGTKKHPRSAQDAPRWSSRGAFSMLKILSNRFRHVLGLIWDAFWEPFWSQKGGARITLF